MSTPVAPHHASVWAAETQQRIYRGLLRAVGYPGVVVDLASDLEGSAAWLGVLATLVDNATTLADPAAMLGAADATLLDAVSADANAAGFVLVDGRQPVPDGFEPCRGTTYRPEGGATLVVVVDAVGTGVTVLALTGPGVPAGESRALRVTGLHPSWWERRSAWTAGFPAGVDLLLCDATRLAALPRTTSVRANP